MARIQASLPENGPDPFLQPTQPSSGCSRTCFRQSQVGRSKRSLEATESEEPGKRGSPTNGVLGSAWVGMGLPLRAVPGKPPCSRRSLTLSPPSRPPGSRLPASWWARPATRRPVTQEGGASLGRLQGCPSCGSARGGAQRARGGAGRRGGGAAGCREGRARAAETAAAAARRTRPGSDERTESARSA